MGRGRPELEGTLGPARAAEKLVPFVKEISEQLTDLNRLFDAVVFLKDAPGEELANRVAKLQADFISQLEVMNRSEQQLLDKEMEMKDAERP